MQVLVIVGVVVFIGIYYVRYFSNIKKAGGRLAAGKIYWREQFGLDADEDVVSMGVGTWYLGPLVPESMRSTAEKVFDALSGTTYRGANMWIAFTSKNRLALAVEPTPEGPRPAASSIGLGKGYAPLAIFGVEQRPFIETAEQAWPSSPHLPTERQKPSRVNTLGQHVPQDLVRVTSPDGGRMTFFVERDWVGSMQSWSRGGTPRIDPQWVSPTTAAA